MTPLLARIAFAARSLRARWRLPRRAAPPVPQIRAALLAAAKGTLVGEDRDWSERIEAMREALLADEREIVVMDYGAGSSGANLTEDEMARGARKQRTIAQACAVSKPRRWALLLFHLARHLRPNVCIELGTCVGMSAAYQAAALQLNGRGRLITLEGAPELADLASSNLQQLGLSNARVVTGRFQDTLAGVLAEEAPVDMVFIDGHHDEEATLRYFQQVRPHLSTPGALVIFDDINWSSGMRRAWDAVAGDAGVQHALSLGTVGLCVVGEV